MRLSLFVVFLILLFPVFAYSHQLPKDFSGFEDPAACRDCHKAIYDEWAGSMHAKSSKLADPVHAAVHDAFMAAMKESGKNPSYFCAVCHTPTADNMDALMKGAAMPDPANVTNARGTTCSFCHKADGLVEGDKFNTYRFTDVIKWKETPSNAPHKVEPSSFASTSLVCMGCHGKMVNAKGGVICSMDEEGSSDCLACHMPLAEGQAADGSARPDHASHAFPASHDPAVLKSGAIVEAGAELGRLVVILKNPNPHFFPSTNPLRVAYLKVEVFGKDGKLLFANFDKDPSEDPGAMLMRVFKAGDKVGVPSWEADGVAKDTRLKANEQRAITYKLPDGAARATAKLYYRYVPGPAMKKFNIKPDGVVEVPQLVSETMVEIK